MFVARMCCHFLDRPISEEEINHLKERHYTALSDKQDLIDQKIQVEVRVCYLNSPSYLVFIFETLFLSFSFVVLFFSVL